MKKLYFLLLLIAGVVQAQIVNIPDGYFKAKLLAASTNTAIAKDLNGNNIKIDSNNDSEIQQDEANAVWYLDVSYVSISDLTGIEAFVNLHTLDCSNDMVLSVLDVSNLLSLTNLQCNSNNLSNLDVSNNLNLTTLDCGGNNLSDLDVSNNLSLSNLTCSSNNLTNLVVSANLNLTFLSCSYNNISTLNLNSNINLTELHCGNNNMSNLNINNNVNLTYLYCADNNLTSLLVYNNPNLTGLWCSNNHITSLYLLNNPNLAMIRCEYNNLNSLNVTNNPNLTFLWCYYNNLNSLNLNNNPLLNSLDVRNNNLTSLRIKNGSNEDVSFQNNPFLQYICVDDSQISAIQNLIDLLGMTTTVCNSYCTFTPGGDYNTIIGTMTFDADNNGCDSSDVLQSNIRVNINDGTNTGASYASSAATYTFYTQTGNFEVTPAVENPSWFNFSPSSATIPFTNINNNTVTQNFCITANGIHPDVEVVIAPTTPARPGFEAVYKVVYKNKGNQTVSGNVSFAYDDAVLEYVSATVIPDAQSTGSLTWNYTNLLPFENRSFYVTLHVNAPTDTPAVNINDILQFTAVINPISGDETPADNTFHYNQTVVGSFDPNDIICMEGDLVPPSEIGNYLHYIINFENTGTADAENIVVKDIIDTTKYDVSSLQLLNSSDPVTAKLTNNIAEFIFQNINLHSGGHGNILLKIKSKNTLVQGNMVSKQANIYFDYNAPIATDMADTTFQSLSNPDIPTDASISVYPNPTKDNVAISSQFTIKSIQLFDVQGRLLQTQLINENKVVFDLTTQAKGVYFVKITSDKGIKVEKVVRE